MKSSIIIIMLSYLRIELSDLLVMRGRDAQEENLSLYWVYIGIDPSSPSSHPLIEGFQPVHVLVYFVLILNIIPSATEKKYIHLILSFLRSSIRRWSEEMKGKKLSYGWLLPVWVHQCQVLKMRRSVPSHAWPSCMESSFSTRPKLSLTMSTRYVDL